MFVSQVIEGPLCNAEYKIEKLLNNIDEPLKAMTTEQRFESPFIHVIWWNH